MSLDSEINQAHVVSWAFKAGKLDISKMGELMQEQERTEVQEIALTAVHQTGLEWSAWIQPGTHQTPPEDLRYLRNLYSC